MNSSLTLLPESAHVFERLALRFGHNAPDKEGSQQAYRAVKPVGEPMTELGGSRLGQHSVQQVPVLHLHIEHRYERRGHDEIEYPLESHGDGNSPTADSVGEYLSNQHPTDGTPREHKRRSVHHDADHRQHFQPLMPECEGNTEGSDGHAKASADEKRLASELLDSEYGHQRKEDVHHTHHHGVHHRVRHAHISKDAWGIIQHRVDANNLLEDGEHHADEDAKVAVGEEFLSLHGDCRLDVREDQACLVGTIDAREDAQRPVVLADADEVARRLGHETDENGELLPKELRLTQFGKRLRSTSLDELPELINILKGDMSIVGPRPLLVKYLPLYNEHQRKRHLVRPGLTGYAQANGRNAISWEEKFDMDVRYVENISFRMDAAIIIKTILTVLKREGIGNGTADVMSEFRGSGHGE